MKLKQLLKLISDSHIILIEDSIYSMRGTKADINFDALEVKVLSIYAWEENVLNIHLEK